jgi:hypothetical protein
VNKPGIALVFLATLPACSLFGSQPPDVTIREKPTPIICDTTQRPEPLDLKDTPPTLVMAPNEVWGYWFNSDLYAALAENLQAMRRYMEQGRDIRAKLIACMDDHNTAAAAEPAS